MKDLNEVLIWRLWAMLLYLPQSLVTGDDMDPEEEDIYKYVLCRNLLDLLTWILPMKGILLPSFRERATYLNSNFLKLQDPHVIDKEFLELINECMVGKFEIKFNRPLTKLYTTVIHYFTKAKEYLLIHNGVNSDNAKAENVILEKKSRKLFHDYHYRRKGYEILFFLKHYRGIGIRQGLCWIFAGKYGLMLEFLYNINLALVSHLNDDKDAKYQLDRANTILQTLSTRKEPKIRIERFDKSWFSLRMSFANFLMDYFRSVQMKANYINSVLNRDG